MAKNTSLRGAKATKDDEFYTQLDDVTFECSHYRDHFKDKTVFCNCDDPEWSNFWVYFHTNFADLGLKKLISTHYNADGKSSYKMEYEGGNDLDVKAWTQVSLTGNGDFRSDECIEILKESDIVVTNPPFSLFRDFLSILMEHDKKFIVLSNQNTITYKEVFTLLKNNKMWCGYKFGEMAFRVPADSKPRATRYWVDESGQKWRSMGNILWYTNLDIKKRHELFFKPEDVHCYYEGNENQYQKYDNYDAIETGASKFIPIDYAGVMGVPITWIDKYNPDEFEIIGGFNGYSECDFVNGQICGELTPYIDKDGKEKTWRGPTINKKTKYFRILVKNKKPIAKKDDI